VTLARSRTHSAAPKVTKGPDSVPLPAGPERARLLDPRAPYLAPTIALLIARIAGWIMIPFASEDAYITFRYARNLAAGNGLVYNPDERVFGFSSPLWAVWSALAFPLIHNPVVWAKLSCILADLVTLLVLTRLLERHASRAAAWTFACFFAVWPYFSAVAASGMEMNLMLMLVALSAALAERGSRATGVVLGLLALVRPEGLAAAAVLALGARWRDRAVAAAIALAGIGALWAYFGTPIPQSLIAKAGIYGIDGPWKGRHWWDWLSPVIAGTRSPVSDAAPLTGFRVVMLPAAVLGFATLWRQRASGLALATFSLLFVWLGYLLLGVAYFWWYLLAPLAGIALAASVGLARVVRGPWIPVASLLFAVSLWTVMESLYRGRAIAEYGTFGEVADFLTPRCRPGEKILLEPIGIIGYQTPLRVIDEVGLVTPRVAARRRAGDGWYTDIVAAERPDWLVIRQGVLRTGQAFAGHGLPFRDKVERDTLVARYEQQFAANPDGGDNALLVLHRR